MESAREWSWKMANTSTANVGSVVYGPHEEKIGTITDIISNEKTMQPMWYEVKVGRLGGRHLLPVQKAAVDRERLVVPYDKTQVKTAPHALGVTPSTSEKARLYEHYELRS